MTAILRAFAVGLPLLALLAPPQGRTAPAKAVANAPAKPVAIVYQLSGKAVLDVPAAGKHSVSLLECLPKGATLQVGPASRLALAFVSGRRYELGEWSKATLGQTDFSSKSGLVRSLPAVPPIPSLAPIAPDDHPGSEPGGIYIRGERIPSLYPAKGAAALVSRAVLRFAAVDGASRYAVEVENGQAHIVFKIETDATQVEVPAGLLHPGKTYFWSVRTVGRPGSQAEGRAVLFTVPANQEKAREELRRLAESPSGGDLMPLLAGVDLGLGLVEEAQEDLDRARQAAPLDTGLAEAAEALERQRKEMGFAPKG